MKILTTLITLSAVAPSYLHGQAQNEYLNWIRQIQTEQTENGDFIEIVQDYHVPAVGSDQSQLGIPDGGALFQLWTLDTTSESEQSWLLDTTTVGANRPQAQITINAPDSHLGIPRTRADVPFTVTTTFVGIQPPAEGVPRILTQVNLEHLIAPSYFPEGQLEIVSQELITENQVRTESNTFTALQPEGSEPAFKVKGIEYFSVETVSDASEEVVISNTQIEVFALSTGDILNLPQDRIISSLPPSIGIRVDDAYPGSEVVFEATVTTPSSTPSGQATVKVIELLNRNIRFSDSEDINIDFSEFSRLPLIDGDEVTFRILLKTPFDVLILDEEDRGFRQFLNFRGSINSLN